MPLDYKVKVSSGPFFDFELRLWLSEIEGPGTERVNLNIDSIFQEGKYESVLCLKYLWTILLNFLLEDIVANATFV